MQLRCPWYYSHRLAYRPLCHWTIIFRVSLLWTNNSRKKCPPNPKLTKSSLKEANVSATKLRPFPKLHGIRSSVRPHPFLPRGIGRWIKSQTKLEFRRLPWRLSLFWHIRLCVKLALFKAKCIRFWQEGSLFQSIFVDSVSGHVGASRTAFCKRQLDFKTINKARVVLAHGDLFL